MTQLPLISMIIPVYNVEQYLDACMESVVGQTYSNLEIILVNDGSKDGSGDICDRWARQDSRIQVIHQRNRGLSGARNAGLEIATGEYVMFVDSDDLLSPQLCQVLYDTLGQDADIAICDPVHIFPRKKWEFTAAGDRVEMLPEDAINRMWYQKDFLPSAWGKLYRRSLFETRRFTVGRLFEDIDVMHEVFYDAEKIVYCNARLYGYQHRQDSITTKAFGKKDLDILLIADKIISFAKDKPALQAAAKAYAVTAALRVWLNVPKDPAFNEGRVKANVILSLFAKGVRKDANIRRKNRIALRMYFTCKPLMRLVYRFVNRWK